MPTTKEAQVLAAGVSYFTVEPVIGPDGEQITNPENGQPINTTLRHEALHGETIELTSYEFDRLAKLNAVREPSDEPLRPKLVATPFGIPLADEPGYQGPIMGDPRPVGSLTEDELLRGDRGGLSPEQALALEQAAQEGFDNTGGGDTPFVWDEETDSGDVEAFVAANDLNVKDTLSLADADEDSSDSDAEHKARAEVVLDAELSRDNPRSGVVSALEKVTEED